MRRERPSARDYVPNTSSLAKVCEASKKCHGCSLYKHATQTVFGEGPIDARIIFVGEQPGDVEDRNGHPFTGPSGKLLDRALEAAGLDRAEAYFTNAVKHFGFQERGKARLHKKPRVIEVNACFPWLEKELEAISPEVIVCLGSTAVRAVLGPGIKVMQNRGKFLPSAWAPHVMVTVHPSSILRSPDPDSRDANMRLFIDDMKRAARTLH